MAESSQESPKSLNIYQRMHAVSSLVRGVSKTRENAHHRFRYTGHEDVTEALRDAMLNAGILRTVTVADVNRSGAFVGVWLDVAYINVEEPSDCHHVRAYGESIGTGRKGEEPRADDQQIGKAISYALKTLELKLFQLLGDSTPDSEADDLPRRQEEEPKRAPPTEVELMDLTLGYGKVRTWADLTAMRGRIGPIVKLLSDKQRAQLSKLDKVAVDAIKANGELGS